MAGIKAFAQTGEVATGTSKKTILQIVAASNHRVLVKEFQISFKGVTNTDAPILVEVTRQSDAGTMSSLTLVKADESTDETLQTTAQHTATVEPTETAVVKSFEVHPQGSYTWQATFGDELMVKGGTRLAIAVTAGVTVNCVASMYIEE